MTCYHLGDQIASILSGCKSCNGKPIYWCNKHERRVCTTIQQAETIAVKACESCSENTVRLELLRPADPAPVTCDYLKRGACEAAARLVGIPLARCAVDRDDCGRCGGLVNLNAPNPTIQGIARRGVKAYDPRLAAALGY